MIKLVNKLTGEVMELPDSSPEEIKESWLLLSETIKVCEGGKDKLKAKVRSLVNDNGLYDMGEYQFRVMSVQRYNYDKAVMREALDPDLFDTFLEPNKTAVDRYIKENVEVIGDTATILRKSMLPIGNPYSVTKLERLL